MEFCEGIQANKTSCHPRTRDGNEFPSTLSFTMHLSTVNTDECGYMQLHHIELTDGKNCSEYFAQVFVFLKINFKCHQCCVLIFLGYLGNFCSIEIVNI